MQRTKLLNPLTAVTSEDPYPYYRRLAQDRPFGWHEDIAHWVAARANIVQSVLENDALRMRPVGEAVPRSIRGTAAGRLFGRLMRMTDGEYHHPLKAAAAHAFRAFVKTGLAPWIDTCALDFDSNDVRSWMFVFPAFAIARALGFSGDALEAAHETATLVRGMGAQAATGEIRRASASAQLINSQMKRVLASGSLTPLLAGFVTEARRAGVPEDAVSANAIGFLFQSFDATAGLIGNTLCALMRTPDALRRNSLSQLVSDVARFDPPVHNTRRYAAVDIELFDCRIAAGDTVLVLLAAANQTPDMPSFTFGSGGHACPAQTVAQTIAQAAVRAVLTRIGIVHLHTAGYRPSPNCRIPEFVS